MRQLHPSVVEGLNHQFPQENMSQLKGMERIHLDALNNYRELHIMCHAALEC